MIPFSIPRAETPLGQYEWAMKRALVIYGHPRPDSFNQALARAWRDGARASGAEVRELVLADLEFDLVLRGQRGEVPLEPDLLEAQELIRWAEHIVLAFPVWWGNVPALVKGFFDRTFEPGFAFKFHGLPFPERLLKGRSATLLTTMDMPWLVYRFLYQRAAHASLRWATFALAGIFPVRSLDFDRVRKRSESERRKMLHKASEAGNAWVRS